MCVLCQGIALSRETIISVSCRSISSIYSNEKLHSYVAKLIDKPNSLIENNFQKLYKKTKHILQISNDKNLNTSIFKDELFKVILKYINSDINICSKNTNPLLVQYYNFDLQDPTKLLNKYFK